MRKKTVSGSNCTGPEDCIALSFLLIVYAVFNLVLVDKYFPITEGWFQDAANYINRGELPYKDFYMFIPPGFPLLIAWISKIFGNVFIVFRLLGIAERLILVALTYWIIRRLFKPTVAAVSCLAGAVVYIANVQELFYGYYQTSLLWGVVCIWLCIRTYEEFENNPFGYAFLFGLCSGISFSFKQTLGLLLSFAIAVMLLASVYHVDLKKSCKVMGTFALGCFLFLSACAATLLMTGTFVPFLEQVFGGADSKGSLLSVLFGFWPRIVTPLSVAMALEFLLFFILDKAGNKYESEKIKKLCTVGQWTALLILVLWLSYTLILARTERDIRFCATGAFRNLFLTGILILGAGCIFISRNKSSVSAQLLGLLTLGTGFVFLFWVMVTHEQRLLNFMRIREARQYCLFAVFLAEFLISVYLLYQAAVKKKKEQALPLIICVASWSIMYVHGFSCTIEDHSALLSLSLFFGYLLSAQIRFKSIKQLLAMAMICGIVLTVFCQRNWFTYHWWGVNMTNTTYDATETFEDPHLRGIYANKETTEPMNEIYTLVEQYKKSDSTMYTFPHISYFNVMSGLPSPTFAKTHYFDVCSDEQAEKDAIRLQDNSPDFIVWMDMPEETWKTHEDTFRSGARSGQWSIREVYLQMTASGSYVLLGVYHIFDADPVYLWVKADLYYT